MTEINGILIPSVRDGLICADCSANAMLVFAGRSYSLLEFGMCNTCRSYTEVLPLDLYTFPHTSVITNNGRVLPVKQQLDLLTQMFDKQTDLYRAACKRIEFLESELRRQQYGSVRAGCFKVVG